MASLNPWVMAASAVPGAIQTGFGIADRIKANRLNKKVGSAPQMSMPTGISAYEALMKRQAQGQMPGYDQERSSIGQGTAQAVQGIRQVASNESSAMAGINSAMSNQSASIRELGLRALQYRAQQQQGLGNAYLQRAQAEQQMFEYNKWLPWQMKKNEIDSLRGAGSQNIYGGLDQIGAAGITGMNMYANQNAYDAMNPNNIGNTYNPASQGIIDQSYGNNQVPNRFANIMRGVGNQQAQQANIWSNI